MHSFSPVTQPISDFSAPKKILTMIKNERMGGSVPKWESARATAKTEIERSLSASTHAQGAPMPLTSLSYYEGESAEPSAPNAPQEFGFADLVDMVNPLQHIPLVAQLYRGVTGDEIKPASQVMGGALFGGALGAAAGLVNVVIQEETGKDITGNALAMARGERPHYIKSKTPEARLNEAVQIAQHYDDLSNSLLAFSDLSHPSGITIERLDKTA